MKDETSPQPRRGEVLVAIMNKPADLHILREQGWYRIPVATAPKYWPPRWLAFYQTKIFGPEAYAIHYFGRVNEIRIVSRRELFPNELPSDRSDRPYYQLCLESLQKLHQPIPSHHWRRIVFIATTWPKFTRAVEINDLFDESPLEDLLWAEFRRLDIAAERQWYEQLERARYFLDFALFCSDGRIDVETDGDTWHARPEQIPEDNRRDNALQAAGWHVLRFNGHQIRESMSEDCIYQITHTINRLGGLEEDGLVPRTFHQTSDGTAQQLTLLEDRADYDLNDDWGGENLE